jgi:lactate dehydrogenase-like 2-hydroxyacid dehydrogenase
MQSNPHAWNLTDLKSVKQNGIKVMSVPPKMTEQVAKAVCSQWLGVDYDANT